jgi:hypothetical protein
MVTGYRLPPHIIPSLKRLVKWNLKRDSRASCQKCNGHFDLFGGISLVASPLRTMEILIDQFLDLISLSVVLLTQILVVVAPELFD